MILECVLVTMLSKIVIGLNIEKVMAGSGLGDCDWIFGKGFDCFRVINVSEGVMMLIFRAVILLICYIFRCFESAPTGNNFDWTFLVFRYIKQ